MTLKILKSQLGPRSMRYEDAVTAFGRLVSYYISERQAWHNHNLIVRSQDDQQPPMRPEWHDFEKSENPKAEYEAAVMKFEHAALNWHVAYPEPIANAIIMAAVGTNITESGDVEYVSDYEVEDDDPEFPSDAEVLRAYQDDLLAELTRREDEALASTLPPMGKRRAFQDRVNKILKSDYDRAVKLAGKESDPVKSLSIFNGVDHDALRPAEDTKFLHDQEEIATRVDYIKDIATSAMSDIEDRTIEDIGKFKLPSFEEKGSN